MAEIIVFLDAIIFLNKVILKEIQEEIVIVNNDKLIY